MDSFCFTLDYEPPSKRSRSSVNGTDPLQCLLKSHLSSQADQMFSEICTLQQHLASHHDQEPEQEGDRENYNGSYLSDLLQSTLDGGDDTGALLSPDVCLQRLREVIHTGKGQAQNSCLLSAEQRVRLDVAMCLFKALKEQQSHRWSEVTTLLAKEYLPIEVVWQFHTSNILSLQTIFDSVLRERRQCTHLTEQIIQLCVAPKDRLFNHKVLSGVCCHLVQNGFPEKKSEDVAFRKVCISILDGVTRGLLDRHMEDTDLLLHTDLWRETADIPHVCFKKFCTHTVSLIMSHRPNMKVSDALKRQAQWKSGKIPDNFKTLYKQLLVPFESGEVVEMLRRILDKQEVNWQTLLSFLATFLVCFPSAAKDIQEHVGGLLGDSLEGGDMENTIVAFLLARQSCTEGAHVFPDYSRWFQETFSDSTRSPAASKKAFTFLVKFLTELVPYEPADILKVHILRPPFVPPKCRDVWTDYTLLAKTRLADLKVPLEETNAAIYTDKASVSGPGEAGVQDVEKAVAAFESSGKLPTTVMEASIFRKPYFVGKFLPALLQPRHLPDIADSKMRFIEALKKAGKIPSAMFVKYEEACKRETRLLLEGVFVEDEEEGVEEMMMSPQEQLTYRLKQLTEAVLSQSTDNRVSELVSIVSEKIEAGLSPSSEDAAVSCHGCVVDLCQPALQPSHVKVVDEVLNCVCRTVHAACDVSQQAWLGQVVQMISQHATLLPALFTRLLTLFHGKTSSLSQHHVEGVASFVVHLTNNAALFPPLIVKNHKGAESQDVSFLSLFLQTLPVSTERQMVEALRFLAEYLQSIVLGQSVNVGDGRDLKAILPRPLIVMTCLLAWRVFPWTRPSHQPQSTSPPSPRPSETGANTTVPEGETEHMESILAALFGSEQFGEVLQVHRPTLEEWLQFELGVEPSGDVLSSLQRQTYHHTMLCHLTRNTACFSVDGDSRSCLQQSCCVVMEVLVKAISRSQTEAGRCSRCQQALHVNPSVRPVNPHAVDHLLMCLSRLVQNVSVVDSRDHEDTEGMEPWVLSHLLQLRAGNEDTIVADAVLRVVLSCPPCMLFTGGTIVEATVKSVRCTVRFVEEFLVGSAAEGGVVSLDVICHLLQGHLAVVNHCRERSVLEPFENHPLIVLSTLVHWQSLCVLLPSLPTCAPWERLAQYVDLWNRHCTEGSLSSLTDKDPFCLAASLYSSHICNRNGSCKAETRQQLLQRLRQKQAKALDCLNAILMASLSDSSICSPCLPPQMEVGLQWLSELWGLFPHLISSAFNSPSELSSVRSSLMSADLEPFAEIVCLRCVDSLETEKIAVDQNVVPTVTRLFARLCQRFEEGTPKQSADVSLILDFSKTVVNLLRTAPLASLQTVSQDDVKQCGLEAHRIYQQRLRTRV